MRKLKAHDNYGNDRARSLLDISVKTAGKLERLIIEHRTMLQGMNFDRTANNQRCMPDHEWWWCDHVHLSFILNATEDNHMTSRVSHSFAD